MKLFLFLLSVMCVANGERLNKCVMAKILLKENVPLSLVGDWICLANHESKFFTQNKAAMPNGSFNYGIFGINDKIWCSSPRNPQGNKCEISCASLTDSNISDDLACAMKIQSTMGFNAWKSWRSKCRGRHNGQWQNECGF